MIDKDKLFFFNSYSSLPFNHLIQSFGFFAGVVNHEEELKIFQKCNTLKKPLSDFPVKLQIRNQRENKAGNIFIENKTHRGYCRYKILILHELLWALPLIIAVIKKATDHE